MPCGPSSSTISTSWGRGSHLMRSIWHNGIHTAHSGQRACLFVRRVRGIISQGPALPGLELNGSPTLVIARQSSCPPRESVLNYSALTAAFLILNSGVENRRGGYIRMISPKLPCLSMSMFNSDIFTSGDRVLTFNYQV